MLLPHVPGFDVTEVERERVRMNDFFKNTLPYPSDQRRSSRSGSIRRRSVSCCNDFPTGCARRTKGVRANPVTSESVQSGIQEKAPQSEGGNRLADRMSLRFSKVASSTADMTVGRVGRERFLSRCGVPDTSRGPRGAGQKLGSWQAPARG